MWHKGEAPLAYIAKDFGLSVTTLKRWIAIVERQEAGAPREAIAELCGNVPMLTAEREAAWADVEREHVHGEQWVQDLHDTYGRHIEQLRE